METQISAMTILEHRRANRMPWERTVHFTQPTYIPAKVVNASAVGLLVRVELGYSLQFGQMVAIEIPRTEDGALLSRNGRVVRAVTTERETFLGVELL